MTYPLTETTLGRFVAKVDFGDGRGCWRWTGARQSRGYGSIGFGPRGALRTFLAHRVAYAWFVGPLEDGLTVDHTCHNADKACPGGPSCEHRRCVNPDHLELVDGDENSRRAEIYSRPGGRFLPAPVIIDHTVEAAS